MDYDINYLSGTSFMLPIMLSLYVTTCAVPKSAPLTRYAITLLATTALALCISFLARYLAVLLIVPMVPPNHLGWLLLAIMGSAIVTALVVSAISRQVVLWSLEMAPIKRTTPDEDAD